MSPHRRYRHGSCSLPLLRFSGLRAQAAHSSKTSFLAIVCSTQHYSHNSGGCCLLDGLASEVSAISDVLHQVVQALPFPLAFGGIRVVKFSTTISGSPTALSFF